MHRGTAEEMCLQSDGRLACVCEEGRGKGRVDKGAGHHHYLLFKIKPAKTLDCDPETIGEPAPPVIQEV